MLELQKKFGYTFTDTALLTQALTHKTCGPHNNERFEFIGDALLNCEVALLLFDTFKDLEEGNMSRVRAGMVRQETLVKIAERIGIAGHLRFAHSDATIRPQAPMLADALEAMFAAVFLDGGREAANRVIRNHMNAALENGDAIIKKDPKTLLQELLQARRIALPAYSTFSHGRHSEMIEATCLIESLGIRTTGKGRTRKLAEAAAAEDALRQCRAQ